MAKPPLALVSTGDQGMNASDANVSTASTTRCGGLLTVSADSAGCARICAPDPSRPRPRDRREAAAEQGEPNVGPPEPSDMSGPAAAIIAEKLGLPVSGDPRLAVASRMHAHADGAAAFFLFHYLRLLSEQTDARAAGRPLPSQTWAMADWSPAPAPRPRRKADQSPRLAAAPAEHPKAPAAGGGNIARVRALIAHGS